MFLAVLATIACLAIPANADLIDINSLALYSGKSLEFGDKVFLDGPAGAVDFVSLGTGTQAGNIFSEGNIYLSSGSQAGNLWANRNVDINNGATVNGDVSVVGDYWKHRNAAVTGTVYHGDDATIIDLPQMGPEPSGGVLGSTSIWKGKNTTTTLDPGSYNNLGFDKDNILNLSSGIYTFNNFWMDKGGAVNVDTSLGDVVLNIYDGLSTGKEVAFNTIGDGKLFINVFDKDVYLGDDNTMDGIFRVYNGGFSTGSGADLTGSVQARDRIWIGNDSTVTYAISDPQTIILLMTGGGMYLIWHRRKRVSFR